MCIWTFVYSSYRTQMWGSSAKVECFLEGSCCGRLFHSFSNIALPFSVPATHRQVLHRLPDVSWDQVLPCFRLSSLPNLWCLWYNWAWPKKLWVADHLYRDEFVANRQMFACFNSYRRPRDAFLKSCQRPLAWCGLGSTGWPTQGAGCCWVPLLPCHPSCTNLPSPLFSR